MIDHPITIADNISNDEHQQRKDVKIGDFDLQGPVDGWQYNQAIDDSENQSKDKNLLTLEPLIKWHHGIIANYDRRISKVA